MSKQEYIGYVDSDYVGDLDKRQSTTGMHSHCPKTDELGLYSTVYYHFAYYRGRVYSHSRGYERYNNI